MSALVCKLNSYLIPVSPSLAVSPMYKDHKDLKYSAKGETIAEYKYGK